MKLPVALQLFSIRDALEESFESTLRSLKDMGYDGLELVGLHGQTPQRIKSLCEEIGLVPISAHMFISYEDMIKDPVSLMESFAQIGVKYVVMPSLDREQFPGGDAFEQVAVEIRRCAKLAKDYGLVMLYHNHDDEFFPLNGKYALDVFYDEIGEDLHTEIDTCWTKVAGVDPAAYVRAYAGKAPVVHVKDYINNGENAGRDGFDFRPLGMGHLGVSDVLNAAVDAGSKWVIVEQDEPAIGLTPMESVKISRDYLKSLGW